MNTRLILLYIPLALAFSMFGLMAFHTENFNPFEYINFWSYFHGGFIGYSIIAFALYRAKRRVEANWILVCLSTFLVLVGVMSYINFGGFNYLLNVDNGAAVLFIATCVSVIGCWKGIPKVDPELNEPNNSCHTTSYKAL